jgi:hypothetical protein
VRKRRIDALREEGLDRRTRTEAVQGLPFARIDVHAVLVRRHRFALVGDLIPGRGVVDRAQEVARRVRQQALRGDQEIATRRRLVERAERLALLHLGVVAGAESCRR